ncbi:anthranilate synthase component I [Legionella oakridgensis]|uniref:Anthranilate synthase n=2 Tax=Legionella oakridgensis TaxID=29423 RepID=W0BF45_9GAMM|nr:anthranilate synthase component I [Legionella oakridgensis]AHE67281.1 anthranilate synthase, alpha proteobacterial clade [Legionella oakridgensis ATCC 33761 = DSM 21215]ETO93110.1 anthranilate synthase, alpha proteobacterial clade [Legionella oakridgensis RV-2-2007]KTD37931.1 anthranilate synthase [Legionella oakridgensis]STY20348.1 anthranilate synthase (glutamine amidotransferase) component I [Legionella longbeachae]
MLHQVKTAGGVHVEYQQQPLSYANAIESLIERLDSHRGALFTSSFEYPGRYTCWDIGFYNPPLAITCRKNTLVLAALNQRGEVLLAILVHFLETSNEIEFLKKSARCCQLQVISGKKIFNEEERSRQPSIFTIVRHILALFKTEEESYLGLYGAFGYDLVFQFETVERSQERDDAQRDMVIYLPDEIFIVNHRKEEAFVRRYEFQFQGKTTQGLARAGDYVTYQPIQKPGRECDHGQGEYAQVVEKAKQHFACGNLFEVVPSQTFYLHAPEKPSAIFKRMRLVNPSPYGFFINLGEEEYLVGASPEMYVRVQGQRVETCPISGTIKRGADAIEDALNIQTLLQSEKECSELTMCTDVDRNDKSRICKPGTVRVIGRRQIEMYSRLIHTVDHVEGYLREEFDALDAFLTHMWVVTVTGAPKLWAMNFIEQHEKSPRKWYGGAVGWFNFNGDINTGLVLRTMRIQQGIAEIRVGATLLYDSDPQAEEQETRLKASAFIDLLRQANGHKQATTWLPSYGTGKKVLLIDHQDSFVHTLANYIRQTGAQVITVRSEHALGYLQQHSYDLVCLSPGPGKPEDFNLSQTIHAVLAAHTPLFGVCLGLQGIVEYFGGTLDVLDYPVHGKPSTMNILVEGGLFSGLDKSFVAGRYHSLYARLESIPDELEVTAVSQDGIVMAVSHKTLPVQAVQFHPETILSMPKQAGLKIINNLMEMVGNNAR